MSLLTLLASCFGRSAPDATASQTVAEHPRFPETDGAGAKFEHVELDPGFAMKTFFISPDKSRVLVLAYKVFGTRDPDDPRPPERTDLRLFALDAKGTITHRLDLTHTDDAWGSSLGMIGDELLLYTGAQFVVIDAKAFTAREKIPVWDETHFPSKQDVELMTPDEQRDAYEPLMSAALERCAECRWLEWPGGKYFVFAKGPSGKRAAWSPMTYEDAVIAPLKERFPPLAVSMNPADTTGEHATTTDGAARLMEEAVLPGGTELDYPNYKSRVVVQYALTTGSRTVHFSTTDRKRHDRWIGLSDNAYLTTADGAVWVRYMGRLYRME